MFRHFADWLGATQLSASLQNAAWVIPTSQSIHILCIGVVFASALMINARLLGRGLKGRSISQLTETLVPWMWRALAVLAFTGAVQVIAEPARQFVTPVFWIKMALIVVVAAMTSAFARRVRSNAAQWDAAGDPPAGAKAFAIVASVMWIAIIACGRFIGYTYALYL
jgi:hypothetical protein